MEGEVPCDFLSHCRNMLEKRWQELTDECSLLCLACFLHPAHRQATVSQHCTGDYEQSSELFDDRLVKLVRLSYFAFAGSLAMVRCKLPAASC